MTIVTLLLSLNTLRTQEAILRALSARMLMCGLQDRDSCTLTPRSFTRLFWVMMPFEVEYWYSSATRGSSARKWPGRGALWQRSSNFCSWRSMLLEVDHSMTWLRSAWVLITSLTESTRPAILVSSAKVLKRSVGHSLTYCLLWRGHEIYFLRQKLVHGVMYK